MVLGRNSGPVRLLIMNRVPVLPRDCIDYFGLETKLFSINWFLDCGEWFVYLRLYTRKFTRELRLSGAGNMVMKYPRGGKR